MMKKALLILALGAFGYSASAQETGKPIHIKLNIGAASATGDFKDTDTDNDKAGFADNGALISLGVSQDLHKNFALGLTAIWRNNPVNVEEAAKTLARESGRDAEVESESYRTAAITVDGYALLPLNQLTLFGKASLGYGISTMGAQDITITDGYDWTMKYTQSSASSLSPVFGIGAGVRYDFGKFGLGLETGLLSTTPTFEILFDGETEKYKQPMTSVNTTITLAYRIK